MWQRLLGWQAQPQGLGSRGLEVAAASGESQDFVAYSRAASGVGTLSRSRRATPSAACPDSVGACGVAGWACAGYCLARPEQKFKAARAPAMKNLSRPAYCWNALKEANRSPQKSTLLNNILGDYQKFGFNPSGRVDRKQGATAQEEDPVVVDLDGIPEAKDVPQPVTDSAQLQKLQAWRENVVNAKRKAEAASSSSVRKQTRQC